MKTLFLTHTAFVTGVYLLPWILGVPHYGLYSGLLALMVPPAAYILWLNVGGGATGAAITVFFCASLNAYPMAISWLLALIFPGLSRDASFGIALAIFALGLGALLFGLISHIERNGDGDGDGEEKIHDSPARRE